MPDKARDRMVITTVILVKKDDRKPCKDAHRDATVHPTLTDTTANKTRRALSVHVAVKHSLNLGESASLLTFQKRLSFGFSLASQKAVECEQPPELTAYTLKLF